MVKITIWPDLYNLGGLVPFLWVLLRKNLTHIYQVCRVCDHINCSSYYHYNITHSNTHCIESHFAKLVLAKFTCYTVYTQC